MATFQSKYTFGDIVYLKTDPGQDKWIVCEVEFRPGATVYVISCGKETYTGYEFELSDKPDLNLKMGVD